MAFSRNHLIAYFLLFLIPYAASLSFDLKNINQNLEIVTEGEAYILDSGIQMITDQYGSRLDWKAGRATYIRELHLWDNTSGELASFATNFSFVIGSRQGRPYADGLTFFLAQKNSVIAHSGALGLPFNQSNMVAHGLASALLYLHEEWEQCVLHRDIKSSNVMLDSNFNPKLGDFGLAKLVDHEKGSQTTMLAGTLGYMAPECVVTGKASKESNVFSFGVVALEIACGRKPIEYKAPERQLRLVEWVWELYGTGTLIEAADPRLGSDFKEDEIKRLMIVGLWCVHPNSDLHPSIRQAIQVLNSEASLPILPSKMDVASYLSLPIASLNNVLSIVQNQLSSSIDNTYSSKQAATSATA